MSFGKNLQYLRRLSNNMTQEALADKLNVSRQTVSKWELDAAQPEIDKAVELCKLFNCSLDQLFREEMDACSDKYVNIRVETVPAFRYVKHAVLSDDPEGDAIDRVIGWAKDCGFEHPRIIGWDFPHLSQEQINVFHMHGYEAAWILPDNFTPEGREVFEQPTQKYAVITIKGAFDDPFVSIPNGYKTLMAYMQLNGLEIVHDLGIGCFETDGGPDMDIYIACK